MATLLELRRRVRSVKNMRQITRAMKLVSGAKLRRAQDAMLASRPYSDKMWEVLGGLAQAGDGSVEHPLLAERPEEHVTAVVVTSDRGLCGAFNSSVLRYSHRALDVWDDRAVTIVTAGSKGWDHFRRRQWAVEKADDELLKDLSYTRAAALAGYLIESYERKTTDAVYLIYNEFVSALSQRLIIEQLLPVRDLPFETPDDVSFREASRAYAAARSVGEVPQGFGAIGAVASALGEATEEAREFAATVGPPVEIVDYIYEPSADAILGEILPRFVETQVYQALLESTAAEHAARMAAMDNATKNAEELIADLTLTMNKLRQEAITTEILEVVGGAEALR
jgi:F-type H+-transporting ATPase subunit gamma